jgi:hypothetical protein
MKVSVRWGYHKKYKETAVAYGIRKLQGANKESCVWWYRIFAWKALCACGVVVCVQTNNVFPSYGAMLTGVGWNWNGDLLSSHLSQSPLTFGKKKRDLSCTGSLWLHNRLPACHPRIQPRRDDDDDGTKVQTCKTSANRERDRQMQWELPLLWCCCNTKRNKKEFLLYVSREWQYWRQSTFIVSKTTFYFKISIVKSTSGQKWFRQPGFSSFIRLLVQ